MSFNSSVDEGKVVDDEDDQSVVKNNKPKTTNSTLKKSKTTRGGNWDSENDEEEHSEDSQNNGQPGAQYCVSGNYVPENIVEEKFVMYTDTSNHRITEQWRSEMRIRRYHSILRFDLLKENSIKIWNKSCQQAKKIDRKTIRRKLTEIRNKFKSKNNYSFDHHSD